MAIYNIKNIRAPLKTPFIEKIKTGEFLEIPIKIKYQKF